MVRCDIFVRPGAAANRKRLSISSPTHSTTEPNCSWARSFSDYRSPEGPGLSRAFMFIFGCCRYSLAADFSLNISPIAATDPNTPEVSSGRKIFVA